MYFQFSVAIVADGCDVEAQWKSILLPVVHGETTPTIEDLGNYIGLLNYFVISVGFAQTGNSFILHVVLIFYPSNVNSTAEMRMKAMYMMGIVLCDKTMAMFL